MWVCLYMYYVCIYIYTDIPIWIFTLYKCIYLQCAHRHPYFNIYTHRFFLTISFHTQALSLHSHFQSHSYWQEMCLHVHYVCTEREGRKCVCTDVNIFCTQSQLTVSHRSPPTPQKQMHFSISRSTFTHPA